MRNDNDSYGESVDVIAGDASAQTRSHHEYDSVTEPLKNGDPLPDHPDDTTAKRITVYGPVYDADDGQQCTAGLHRNELARLQDGDQMALTHLYRYVITNKHVYHTRKSVIIHVKTTTDEQ